MPPLVRDRLPDLPEIELAPWQQKRLPLLTETTLIQKVGAKDGGIVTRSQYEPSWTVRKGHDGHWEQFNAFIAEGTRPRFVTLHPKDIARFQTVPDDYEFSGDRTLDIGIIGNGVPVLMAKTIASQISKRLVQTFRAF